MRLFQSHGKLQSSPAPGPSLSGLEVMFPLSACVTGSLRFSPSSSALWPEPKSPDRSPFAFFAYRPLFPRPTLLAPPLRKKKPYWASAHTCLLSLFNCACVRICSGTSFHRLDYLLPCTSYNPLYLLSPRGLELLTRSGPILSILLPCLVGPPSGRLLV